MQTNRHVSRTTLETLIVGPDVGVQKGLVVDTLLFHTLDHALGTEVGKQRVVDLDVAASRSVEFLDLLLVRERDVVEVCIVVCVHVLRVRMHAVAQVVPLGGTHRDLEPGVLRRVRQGLESGELRDVKRARARHLARADVGSCVLEGKLLEGGDVGDVVHEHVHRNCSTAHC